MKNRAAAAMIRPRGTVHAARLLRSVFVIAACALITNCGNSKSTGLDALNIYGWTDYHDEALIRDFTRKTGIRVTYDMFDSSDAAEAKLLAGGSGYDIVTVSNPYLGRQVKIRLYAELDRSQLSDWRNLDPTILGQIAIFDPGNRHALPYVWGITGTIYNIDAVAARMPHAPLDSLAMFFDPNVVSKFADCGVSIFDLPFSVYQMVLAYLARDPNQFTDDNLDAAQQQLLKVRPYIRKFDTDNWSQTLLDGDVCVAMGWPGTLSRVLADMPPAQIKGHFNAVIPKGSEVYFDNLAILADAPHKAAAYQYFQFLLDAHNAAAHINRIRYAVGNKAATPFIAPAILNNPGFYPPVEVLKTAHQQMTVPPEFQRKMTRYWTELKAHTP
jgi:putrescine transport system substrate-binding protein